MNESGLLRLVEVPTPRLTDTPNTSLVSWIYMYIYYNIYYLYCYSFLKWRSSLAFSCHFKKSYLLLLNSLRKLILTTQCYKVGREEEGGEEGRQQRD